MVCRLSYCVKVWPAVFCTSCKSHKHKLRLADERRCKADSMCASRVSASGSVPPEFCRLENSLVKTFVEAKEIERTSLAQRREAEALSPEALISATEGEAHLPATRLVAALVKRRADVIYRDFCEGRRIPLLSNTGSYLKPACSLLFRLQLSAGGKGRRHLACAVPGNWIALSGFQLAGSEEAVQEESQAAAKHFWKPSHETLAWNATSSSALDPICRHAS